MVVSWETEFGSRGVERLSDADAGWRVVIQLLSLPVKVFVDGEEADYVDVD